jgi:hypothetical protein
MVMQGPGKDRLPNATYRHVAHKPTMTAEEYRAALLAILDVTSKSDLAWSYNIPQLEEDIISNGLALPIVRIVDEPKSE